MELRNANEALGGLTAELENRVSERTRQLEEAVLELRRKKSEVEAYAETVAHELLEKEVLLREVYHRVKNNLQVVQSLLKMGARTLESVDAQESIDAAVQRIQVMATVHERLYQMPNLASLSLPAYLKDIVDGAVASGIVRLNSIDIQFAVDEIPIDLDLAIPMGLLVNELVSNCLKHGLRHNEPGLIKVSVSRTPLAVRLVIQDNGCGLPANFEEMRTRSMGLKLAASLAKRLGGQLKFNSEDGCRVEADLTRL
jgi:two-component sensor histidine kinase